MGYTKQDFKSGEKLFASQLNAMDEQIAQNTEALEEKQPKGDYPTIEELEEGYQPKGNYPTKEDMAEAIANAQLGGGDAPDTSGFLTKEMAEETYQPKIDDLDTIRENAEKGAAALQEVPSEYIKESDLKTINGVSIVGKGNIELGKGEVTEQKDYVELEFIEGTENQKIQTDFLLEENDVIEMDYMIPKHNLNVAGDKVYITTPTSPTNNNRVRFSTYGGTNKKFYVRFGDDTGHTTGAVMDESKMSGTIILKKGAFIINGETIAELNFKGMPDTPLVLFSTDYPTYFRMYAFRILRDEHIIHNLIPNKRVSDSSVGFLDVVTDVFYENVGGNPFIYKEKTVVPNKEYYTKEQIVPLEQFREDDFVTKTKDFLLKQGTNDKGESLLFPLLSTTGNARCFAFDLEDGHTYEIKIKNLNPDSTTWRMRIALWDKEYKDIKFVPAKQDDVQNVSESVGTPAKEILISDYQKSNEFTTTFKNDSGYKTIMGLLGWGIEYSYLDVSIRDLDSEKLSPDIKVTMDNISDDTRRAITQPWTKFMKKPISEQDKINLTNILVGNMGRCNKATQKIMELAYDFWKHRDEFMYSNGTARDNAWNYWSTEGYYDVNTGNNITAENAGWKKIDCSTFVYYVSAGIGYYSSPYYNALEQTEVVQGALTNGVEAESSDETICRTGKMWIRANKPFKLESSSSSTCYFRAIYGYAEDDTLIQTFNTVSIGAVIKPNTDVKYLRAEMKVSSVSDYAPAVTTIPKAPAAILKKLRIREDEQLEVRGLCPSSVRYADDMCRWYDDNGYALDYNRWKYSDNDFPVGTIMWWGRNTSNNYKGITHITMYIGNGYLIHSSTGSMGLTGGQGLHIQTLEELFGSYTEPLSGIAIPEYITEEDAIDLSEFLMKTEASASYQPKGDYATKTEVAEEIAKAQLGGSGSVDTSLILTKTEAAKMYQPKGANYTNLMGKTVSVIGDSISTFADYLADSTYLKYFPKYDVTSVEQTWWKLMLNKSGMVLHKNCSYSGSYVTGSSTSTTDASAGCSTKRINDLAKNGVAPDIVICFIGINNLQTSTAGTELGNWKGGTLPSEGTINTFSEAYALMVSKILKKYPKTEVFLCTLLDTNKDGWDNDGTSFPTNKDSRTLKDYNDMIRFIAEAFGVNVIDIHACGVNWFNLGTFTADGLHPNAEGMKQIAKKMLAEISAKSTYAHPVDEVEGGDEPIVPTEHTVTYKYVDANGATIKTSDTTKVEDGTTLNVSTANAPSISGYAISSVTPSGSIVVNANTTITYTYNKAEEPETPDEPSGDYPTETTWYIDVATKSNLNSSFGKGGASYVYVDDAINGAVEGKYVNAFRCAFHSAGTFAYGKCNLDAQTYEKVGSFVVTSADLGNELHIFKVEPFKVEEGERVWFMDSEFAGKLYYQLSPATSDGAFGYGITATNFEPTANPNKNLSIDVGFVVE